MNHILNTDSYKFSHYRQYPNDAEYVSSYVEARGGKFDETVFFGLQMYLKEYLRKPITQEDINEAEEIAMAHVGMFNRGDWEEILKDYGGHLPIKIQAVPEGTVVPVSNVLVQVQNTDDRFPWLTSYMETAIHRAVWYPTTVATMSREIKKIILEYLYKTADEPEEEIGFKLHDFGARGVTSKEQAGLGGLAHLVNFSGTDTVEALLYGKKYYGEEMAGFSIPASEHSTITTWGGPDQEVKAFENMITQFGKKGSLFACVSDSYDIWRACQELWGEELKEQVMNNGGTLVVRPDSGDPVEVPITCIEMLMNKFGHTVNSKGYKVLPDYLRVIQGDGISITEIEEILQNMEKRGLSASNIAFGMGAGLLQKVNRDTCKFAMKASAIRRKGVWYDVFKDPVTDHGKVSKKGILALTHDMQTVRAEEAENNMLRTVFDVGHLLNEDTLQNVRQRAAIVV